MHLRTGPCAWLNTTDPRIDSFSNGRRSFEPASSHRAPSWTWGGLVNSLPGSNIAPRSQASYLGPPSLGFSAGNSAGVPGSSSQCVSPCGLLKARVNVWSLNAAA